MVAKFPNHHIFLDEDGHLDCRTMEVWATVLLLGVFMSFHVNIFFSAIFAGPRFFLRSRDFATKRYIMTSPLY